jgi:lipopolysaccharide transport system ATP-binding protein
MSDIAIRVENLSKQYRIGQREAAYKTLRESVMNLFTRRSGKSESIWALKDVSFQVERGQVIGIIGRNGAGKSTLLKILSRVTEPTEGYAYIKGRVGSLLEVGTGFHPELTGRENIFLNGAILGMRKAEIERKFDEIVAFAEIEKFIDTPVKRYSSGMYVRLAFAVAAHLEPEILLVDEVLAVGDVAFQKKCLGKMGDVAKEGRTILFVSHNMAAVQALCNRGILLEAGSITKIGGVGEAVSSYLETLNTRAGVKLRERKDRRGSGLVRLVEVRFENSRGQRIEQAVSGQDLSIALLYEVFGSANHASFAIGFYNSVGVPLLHCNSWHIGTEFARLSNRGEVVCRIPKLPLPAGTYRLNVAIQEKLADTADHVEAAAMLHVLDGDFFGTGRVPPSTVGACLVEHSWRLRNGEKP